ncbi:multidrug transporter AcrB [Arachidicoccus ginsenosidimutans]|uniref:efflux RND transporter permease subunit n=1 Tax=Arachidicoccus sp. BS20 TaxID=1850526 RepID=UPI0007F0741C|nr:efflux RND transporter permease subunit [Arachidicoccus sp. BS20]ANI87864.1 multidrug transporter AcrB [Arachidicoccus sp. BS20]
MLKKFIERPVLSTVISVLIVLLGVLGLVKLPIEQYPDIAPPTVQVSASYGGANAQTVMNTVIIPLEQQINGVEDMTYMTSTATNTGQANISVYFDVGRDPDQAAVDVSNRISAVMSKLPAVVVQSGVTVRKQQSSNLLILALYSDKPAYDQTFLQNYAYINITPQLSRVMGVGAANVFGSQMTYAMRIWLKPDVMATYGVSTSDVTNALNEQNVQAAPGTFGLNDNQSFNYVIVYPGTLVSPEQFGNIIIKATGNGQYLRLKDIARVELGAQSYTGSSVINGKQAVAIAINQTPGSNAHDVIINCEKVMSDAAKSFPDGIKYVPLVDINMFLNASIDKVLHTLVECFLLVFLVILFFLQDLRSTIVHGISVPVAIIGTFFFLYLFGYSINLLTLFALVLAIGIVVDDAIVVVEAVHAKLENGYTSPRKAAIDAIKEIAPAIVSITLVMSSVFLPVTFLSGSAGVFYRQFGVTMAIAIAISAVNALTLSPALAALVLKPPIHTNEEKKGTVMHRFSVAFNKGYDKLTDKYVSAAKAIAKFWWLCLLIVAAFSALLYFLMKSTPSSFVPSEDMGTIYVDITLPPSSTMERVTAMNQKIDSIVHTVPQVQYSMQTLGRNHISGNGSAYGQITIRLTPWDERPGITVDDIIQRLIKKTSGIRGAKINFMQQPTIKGFGTNAGFSFQIQDRAAHSYEDFYKVGSRFLDSLNARPEIQYAASPFNPHFPQYELNVNVAKCKDAGIAVNDLLKSMQVFYGGLYVNNFNEFGQQYQVIVQADTNYTATIQQLNNIQIKTGSGTMSPVSEFITLDRIQGPDQLARFNMYNTMSVSGAPNQGYSTGEAMQAIDEVAAKTLPAGYSYEYSGISREEQNAGSQTVYIFILSLTFVYLLLSALYESYLVPFAVLLSIPVGLAGVFVFTKLANLDFNIYVQISLVMLIGLLAKNAILMVEFSLERRRKGMSIFESAMEGAKARLRPILMTSMAFICGLLPLVFSSGVGANGNKAIGMGAIGGMLFGTCLGVFVIPALYILFQGLQEKIKKNKYDENGELIAKPKKA